MRFPKANLIFRMALVSTISLGTTTQAWSATSVAAAAVIKPVAAPVETKEAVSTSNTKSFSDWKNEKIRLAKEQLTEARLKVARPDSSKKTTEQAKQASLEANYELTQGEFNLEVAEGLSITDYLVLYLSNQPGRTKFKEAASRLTPEETAKILEAYLKAREIQQDEETQASRRSSAADLLN